MGPRVAILGGLLAGILVGGLLLAALIAFLPPVEVVEPTRPPGTNDPGPSPSRGATPQPLPTAVAPAAPTPATDPDGAAFHVGEAAPPLDVPLLGGGSIELEQLRGHPVWIVFMATWCPTCLDELPLMNGFAARYADEGLVVTAIDVAEPEEAVAEYMDQLGVVFPVGLDLDGSAADAWGVVVPPIHFFVDAAGVIREGALGGIGPDVMAASLQTIMPGVEVVP